MDNTIQAGVNNPVFANQYFDGTYDPTQGSVYQTGNVLSNLLDDYTGEEVQFVKVEDTSGVTIDGILYRQKGEEVFVDAEFLATGYIDVARFGIKGDGVTDNTANYIKLVAALPNGAEIKFARAKKYLGNLRITKSISLDLNYSTFVGISANAPAIRIGRSATNFGTAINPVSYGARYVKPSTIEGMEIGDLFTICDGAVRPADNMPEINKELLKIKNITETNGFEVEDMIRSDQSIGIITIQKVLRTSNFSIKNGFITDSGAGILLEGCENITIENIHTERLNFGNIRCINCNNIKVYNCSSIDATATGAGGAGYGAAFVSSRNVILKDFYGRRMRHAVDFSTCYNASIENINTIDDVQVPVVLSHNTYGGNFNVRNVRFTEFGWGVLWSPQGVMDREAFIARDITIRDISQVRNLGTNSSSNGTVFIGTSYSNLIIENSSMYNTNLAYSNAAAHVVILLGGNPVDKSYINNIYANRIGTLVSILTYNNTAPQINDSLLVLDNLRADSSRHLCILKGGYNVQIGNISQSTSTGPQAILVESLNGLPTVKTLDFSGKLSLPTDKEVVNIPVENDVPYQGRAPRSSALNDFAINVGNGSNYPITNFQHRTLYKLLRRNPSASDAIIGDTRGLPKPTHLDQEIILSINDGMPRDVGNWDIIVPNTNLYLANSPVNVRLHSGKNYLLRANNQFKWVIMEMADMRANYNNSNVSTRLISNGDDLNRYKIAGIYHRAAGTSGDVLNSPTDSAGMLQVLNSPTNNNLVHSYYELLSNTLYTRTFTTSWSPWVKLSKEL
jgi:hypothetical protein